MFRVLSLIALVAIIGCQTYTPGTTLPSSAYLEYQPKDYTPPASPVSKASSAQPGTPVDGPVTPAQPATLAPPTPRPVPPAPSSLTVANVHKEAVTVFTVRGGELGFVARVPPGEAVDIPVSADAKLAAVFSATPHCVNYAFKGTPGEVWLLRPAPAVPTPTTCGPGPLSSTTNAPLPSLSR